MKLICDICGGELHMNSDGSAAICSTCGLTYPKERLQQKIREMQATPAINQPSTPVINQPPTPVQSQPAVRYLTVMRKFNLNGCAAKTHILVDGQEAGIVSNNSEVRIPIYEGVHEISGYFKAGNLITSYFNPIRIHVKDKDWMGRLYVSAGAIKAEWIMELHEMG